MSHVATVDLEGVELARAFDSCAAPLSRSLYTCEEADPPGERRQSFPRVED